MCDLGNCVDIFSSGVDVFCFAADLCPAQEFDRSFHVCIEINTVQLASFIYDNRNKAKSLSTSARLFSDSVPTGFIDIYACYGVCPLYVCLEFQSITSTLLLPKMHKNMWSE